MTERPDEAPAIIRGLLTLKLHKPSRIRKIEVKLEGKSRTEWPEGIGPRRTETSEEKVFISETLTFFTAAQSHSRSRDRRAVSLGPGGRIDEDWGLDEQDELSDGEGHHDDGLSRGRAGRSGYPDTAERGRLGIGRVQPRSYSAMPEGPRPPLNHTQTQPPTRRQSFDRDITTALHSPTDEVPGATLGDALRRTSFGDYTHNTPRQPARNEDLFRQRGPSPAYSVRDPLRSSSAFHPRTSSLRRGADQAESSAGRPAGGYHYSTDEADLAEESLSPIASADVSAETSRWTSPSREATSASVGSSPRLRNARPLSPPRRRSSTQAPIFEPVNIHQSLDTPRGSISALPEGSPASNENRHSISSRSEQNYISVTRPGSRQSSLVEQMPSPQQSPVLGPQSHRSRASREGSMSSLMRPPALSLGVRRQASGSYLGLNPQSATASQVSIPGHITQEPTASSSSSLTAGSQAGERGRKPSKFSFASVSNTLRNLSKSGATSRSQSRASPMAPGLGRQRSHEQPMPALNRESSVVADGRLRRLADEDEEFRPFGRGGAGRSPSRSGRASSATRAKEERSESRSRGRHIGLKALTGALKGEDWDDGEAGVHNWKEFRKGK